MLEKIQTENIQKGMYIVCSANNYPPLPSKIANTYVTTKDVILTLLRCDIKEVLIDSYKSSIRESIQQTPYSDEILFARETYAQIIKLVQNIFKTVEERRDIDIDEYKKKVTPLLDSIERNSNAAASLTILLQSDQYIFAHSLNTAILSAVLGRFLGHSTESLKDLIVSALLMNIGEIWIPDNILKKHGKLIQKEFSIIKQHPALACEYLNTQDNIPQNIIETIYSHHEREDCSGYPEGSAGNKIPKFARIISICDSYDAMTSSRPYREAMTPNMAIKHLYSMKDSSFHTPYLESFIKCIGIYPTGCFVKLSDGRYGVVMKNTPSAPLLPEIKIVFDSRLRAILPEYINLLQEDAGNTDSSLEIIECIHPKTFKLELDRFLW
ncbi:HD-GYP domain-containing protein [Desulfovibrio gilichinskyi]|uniref:Metal dependent phosphohydrolase n=1 Tax=Desulfovibrio gilichinskyi TaxID=1519643 RepID=A0A1X7C8Y0_9BACT|nr:HD-GYP domain-containing protein [Desulfovibrio gilichinskyi]SME92240.1 metal dependent phosphohydrolase [Desulfovibrio gilichinskyi]